MADGTFSRHSSICPSIHLSSIRLSVGVFADVELHASRLIKRKVDSMHVYFLPPVSQFGLFLGGGGKVEAMKACEAADNAGDNRFDRQNVAQADKFVEILQQKSR